MVILTLCLRELCSQSNELRNVNSLQTKNELKPKVTQDKPDEFIALIRYQRKHSRFQITRLY